MRSIEVSARTIDDAVGEGLAKLGCSISDCKVDIIQEGAKGLFGVFGSKPAMVRLTLLEENSNELQLDMLMQTPGGPSKNERPPSAAEEIQSKPKPQPAEKNVERKPAPQKKTLQEIPLFQGGQPPSPRGAQENKPAARKADPQKPHQRPPIKPGDPWKPTKPETADAAQNQNVLERFRNAPLPGKQKPVFVQRPQRRHVVAHGDAREFFSMPDRTPMAAPKNIPLHDENTPEGVMQVFLLEVTKRMGVSVQVDVRREAEGHIVATMFGDTLGILIGRRGETLDALQYLASLQINKGREEYIRCTLDTENYRAKREEALSRLAARMANRAVKTGRKVSLEPMNPYERRILHSSLQSNPHVTTHSEGDEPFRHVVVVPQK